MLKLYRVCERVPGESEPTVAVLAQGDAMTCVLKLLPMCSGDQLNALKQHGVSRAQREVREREMEAKRARAERVLEQELEIVYSDFPPPESADVLALDDDAPDTETDEPDEPTPLEVIDPLAGVKEAAAAGE